MENSSPRTFVIVMAPSVLSLNQRPKGNPPPVSLALNCLVLILRLVEVLNHQLLRMVLVAVLMSVQIV